MPLQPYWNFERLEPGAVAEPEPQPLSSPDAGPAVRGGVPGCRGAQSWHRRPPPAPCSRWSWGPRGPRRQGHHPFSGDHCLRPTSSPGGGRTHPGGRDGRFRGPDTKQALLDTVTDPHTGDRTKNGSSLRFASGSALVTPSTILDVPPPCPLVPSRKMGGLRLSVVC